MTRPIPPLPYIIPANPETILHKTIIAPNINNTTDDLTIDILNTRYRIEKSIIPINIPTKKDNIISGDILTIPPFFNKRF